MFTSRQVLKQSSKTLIEEGLNLQIPRTASLVDISVRNKISWQHQGPYNKRWQYKWKSAYYSYPREGSEDVRVKKPEDSKDANPIFTSYIQDVIYRWLPGLKCWWDRRHRMYDPFSVYFIPGSSLFMFQFWELNLGFKILTILPWLTLYVRIRDKTLDPDFKETYLRDIIYKNPEISALFQEETIHVLDYDCEYDKGIPNPEKFPEYSNKVWSIKTNLYYFCQFQKKGFFNTDTAMCTGHFTFGDVESGATMVLKFKTMPIPGKFRYQVGEPFYFYDLRAHITHNGIFKEVVINDENETLKRIRPFLFLF